jgi:Flp pilus assembly protein TadG
MKRLIAAFIGVVRHGWKDESGVTAPIVAMLLVSMLGLSGMAIDLGHAYVVRRALQSSTDAAALAGGYNIPNSTAKATARQYSALTGDKNASGKIHATMVSGYPKLKCLASTAVAGNCAGNELAGGANAIQVEQTAAVPTYFLRLFGVNSIQVTTLATASAKGGSDQKLNVMVILDATGSMGSKDTTCGLGNNSTREQCALAGVQALLQGLNPSLDYVGLMTFPGIVNSSQASNDYTCGSSSPPTAQMYNNSPVYQIVGLTGSNNFKSSNTSQTLNTSSNIVLAAGGGGAGCTSGISPIQLGNPPTYATYYAQTISAAQAALVSFAQPHTQNVIILLSDGDANTAETETNVTGYIAGTTLNVTACPQGCAVSSSASQQGPLSAGEVLTGTGVTSGTTIVQQLSGTTGGIGTYQVNLSQTVGSSTNTKSFAASSVMNYGAGYSAAENVNECHQAIWAAQNAAAAGTWVYVVAYGAAGSGCSTDQATYPGWTPCQTLQDIASSPSAIPDASKFYSDGSGGTVCPFANSISNLVQIFQNISSDLALPRLLPDNTA